MEQQERFCPNEECSDYGKKDQGNIVKNGHDRKGIQRYKCKSCGQDFTATRETPLHKLKTDWVDVLEALAMLAERNSIAAVARVKEVKPDTVAHWVKKAGEHAEVVETVLVQGLGVDRVQLDGLWSYVKNKGEKGGIRKARRRGSSGS